MRKAVVSPGAVVKANNDLITLANSIGRTVNGNKCATGASSGQFVVLLNSTISGRADGLYTASKAIPANTAIDSSYLTSASEGGLNVLNGKHSRTFLGGNLSPSALMEIDLNDSVLNYDYIQIFAGKDGNGTFMSTIIHHDDIGVGNNDVISLTAYNNSSYNAYIECGFTTNTKFSMPTFRQTGWTIKPLYIVGIGKRT